MITSCWAWDVFCVGLGKSVKRSYSCFEDTIVLILQGDVLILHKMSLFCVDVYTTLSVGYFCNGFMPHSVSSLHTVFLTKRPATWHAHIPSGRHAASLMNVHN